VLVARRREGMRPRAGETPEQFAGRLVRRENLVADLEYLAAWLCKVLMVVGALAVAWCSWRAR
jgi:hypothetical protein